MPKLYVMEKYINTERWDQWVADGGITRGRDKGITVQIPVDLGVGVQKLIDGKLCTATREYGGRDKNYLKTVTLNISSFVGVSIGAQHCYGVLRASGVEFEREGSASRYSPVGSKIPAYLQAINFEITREVIQAMIDADPEMWEYYDAGGVTDRFDTVEEIVKKAKAVFKQWFGKGWKLVLEKDWSNEKKVLKK